MELQTLSIMIEEYVRGNLNISRKRLLQPCKEGGLAFLILEIFWMHSDVLGLNEHNLLMITGNDTCTLVVTVQF